MTLIADRLFTQAINSVFIEAGNMYSQNPEFLLEIIKTLTRITFELENLQHSRQEYDDEYVGGLLS